MHWSPPGFLNTPKPPTSTKWSLPQKVPAQRRTRPGPGSRRDRGGTSAVRTAELPLVARGGGWSVLSCG